jgi:chromate transport protein ChrA
MEYAQLIIVAILIEAIWENLKMIWKDRKISLNTIGVLVISIIVCLLAKIDIFPIVGLSLSVPFVGSGLTGIIVSRGANFVNDLFEKLKVK